MRCKWNNKQNICVLVFGRFGSIRGIIGIIISLHASRDESHRLKNMQMFNYYGWARHKNSVRSVCVCVFGRCNAYNNRTRCSWCRIIIFSSTKMTGTARLFNVCCAAAGVAVLYKYYSIRKISIDMQCTMQQIEGKRRISLLLEWLQVHCIVSVWASRCVGVCVHVYVYPSISNIHGIYHYGRVLTLDFSFFSAVSVAVASGNRKICINKILHRAAQKAVMRIKLTRRDFVDDWISPCVCVWLQISYDDCIARNECLLHFTQRMASWELTENYYSSLRAYESTKETISNAHRKPIFICLISDAT